MRAVIHELRNHLAVAMANVEAFIDGKLAPTPARLTAVLQALNEVDVLLNDLGQPETAVEMPTQLRTFNICELLENQALAIEAAAHEKGVGFSLPTCEHKHSECARFKGDPVRLGSIVTNVLLNAIRYTPSGGNVAVDCRRAAGHLEYTVSDQGRGIAAAEAVRIFEPGFRGTAAGDAPGSGLGLAVVRKLVEEHGGTVSVDSQVGGGTTFRIRLPGAPEALEDADRSSCAAATGVESAVP